MSWWSKLNKIFLNSCNYDVVNVLSDVQLRKINNGISIQDAVLYKLKYAEINTTKESISSFINNYNKENNINNKTFTRMSFESKEKNIGIEFYTSILNQIMDLYNTECNSRKKNEYIFMAIDGTNNNNHKYDIMLNMGYFDINNKIPIDLTCNGTENRNKEVQMVINDITNNSEKYNNAVIVGDRLYFTYEFMDYLVSKNIKFIIRAKGNGDNLDEELNLKKGIKHHDIIKKLRNNIRIIRYKNTYDKIVNSSKSKKNPNKTYYLRVKNDCVLITNLMDDNKYNNEKILELYRKRWEIEIFFKFIKKNFKVQFMKEKDLEQYKRLYICELILTYIAKIIKYYHLKNKSVSKVDITNYQINESLLMKGIFDVLLHSIINGKLTKSQLYNFGNSYIKNINNKKDRHFPRTAKRPFCKWYLKGYSASTRLLKIIESIENNKVYELHRNLKLIANRITISKIVK